MTIAKKLIKYFLIIILVVILILIVRSCYYMFNEAPEPVFKVYGDKAILDKMVINIETINFNSSPYTYSKIQTLLYKGEEYSFQNEYAHYYKVYYSYNDQVGFLEFENLYARNNDSLLRINYIYVISDNNKIYLKYYPFRDDLGKDIGRKSNGSLLLAEYFREKDITEDQQEADKEKFYNLFKHDEQSFKKDPLSQHSINSFKNSSLDVKKEYGLTIEDLKTIDIPEEERQILIKHAENIKQVEP